MKSTLKIRGREYPVELAQDDGRIVFVKSPFAMKDEIRAMAGPRWNHQLKRWTVTNNARNSFQLRFMLGEKVYAHFEQPLTDIESTRPLHEHQVDAIRRCLTYRYQIVAAEPGLGKSLVAFEVCERIADESGGETWYVGPRSALESVRLDRIKWDGPEFEQMMTYERLSSLDRDTPPPRVLILDESTYIKTPGAARTQAAQHWANRVREVWGFDGAVILLSGTPTCKRPSDLWAQAEIAWPGFLREGSLRAFEERYALVEDATDANGVIFRKIAGWKEEEVSEIPARTDGLMSVYRREHVVELPERTFSTRACTVSPKLTRIARAIAESSPNVISAITRLRALSSGFQYDPEDRKIVETDCPKDDHLRELLAEESDRGRIVIGASFQGSIDRVRRICQASGWAVVQVDGRKWQAYDEDGDEVPTFSLEYWAKHPGKVAFVANPASARFGLTLIEATTVVVFDQNFSAEHRLQFLDRIYRIGQTHPVRVVDLLHLPCDQLILDTLKSNRRLELLSLGQIRDSLE